MVKKIKAYVEKWQMLEKEDCVVVGISGGADSVCLLLVLLELQKEILFRLVAVHVNHGIRGKDAEEDAEFVKKLCEKHHILLETYVVDVESIAKKRKQSTEEAGREVRRTCFEEVAEKCGGTRIALAHHQNDNAETLVLNLARGTGLKGLGGIAPVNGRYIRPLLGVSRKEIEMFLHEKGISYCTDATNQSDLYTRNKVRRHILPYLEKEVNDQTISHMNDAMESLRNVQDYLQEQVCLEEAACVRKRESGVLILRDRFVEIHPALQSLLLHRTLAQVCGCEKDIASIHIVQLQELFGKQNGRRVHLPYGMEAVRSYEGVEIELQSTRVPTEYMEEIEWVKTKKAWNGRWMGKEIICNVYEAGKISVDVSEKKCTKLFDYDIIKGNLCFRSRRSGDYIQIHRDGSTQKIKSYFINEKIPQKEREQVLLVTVENEVLWAPGYRRSCGYAVTEHTKTILEITINEGESYGRQN